MKRSFYLLIVILFFKNPLHGQGTPYISPGFTLSFNFNGYFIFSPKISIGYVRDGKFINITFGRSFSKDTSYYPNMFFELQYGVQSSQLALRKQALLVGGGVGLTIPSSKTHYSPSMRVSVFAGFLCFLNATALLKDTMEVDIGPQLVLPIPLKKIEIGKLGG